MACRFSFPHSLSLPFSLSRLSLSLFSPTFPSPLLPFLLPLLPLLFFLSFSFTLPPFLSFPPLSLLLPLSPLSSHTPVLLSKHDESWRLGL